MQAAEAGQPVNGFAVQREAARDGVPDCHIEVAELFGNRSSFLSRQGEQYFVDGKPVTLKKAFAWFIKFEDADGGSGTCAEVNRLLKAVAKLLK